MAVRCIALLAVILAPLIGSAQDAARRVRIAVMEIRALGTEPQKAELLSEIALTEASSFAAFDVIGKSDIGSMIGFEKQKQVTGCTEDSNCLAEIGGALGVDFILVGSLGRMGNLYRLDLKLVEIKKARVRARMGINVEGSEERLVAGTQKLVRDMLAPEAARVDAAAIARAPATTQAPATVTRPVPAPVVTPAAAPRTVAPGTTGPGIQEEASARGGGRRTGAYVAGGIGVALVLGGAVAGLQAKSAFDGEKSATTMQGYTDNKNKATTMAMVADGLYLGGAIGLGVGGWLYFSGRPASGVSLNVSPAPGGAIASISGGF